MLINLKKVSKTYHLDGVNIEALKEISLQINTGEFVAVMGPSGSGKSTLMNLIGLLDTPTAGTLKLKNRNPLDLTDAQRARLRNETIGFIFQQFNLLQRIPALANVTLPLLYSTKNNKNPDELGKEVLTKVGLGDRLGHHPNQLSGGQQQRVAIARALINNPEIILADEPTGNLDTKTGGKIMQLLTRLNQQGHTVIAITHEPHIAEYAKRTINILDGEIKN